MAFEFKEKVILICIDGMRPDGFLKCGNPFTKEMMKLGSYCLESRTVFPSSTLPCHMSMFFSVPPERHGILSNTYVPMVRPLPGLFEQIRAMGGKSDMYFGWQPLRDIGGPKTLCRGYFICARMDDDTDTQLTDLALERLKTGGPDFAFLYQVETDQKGGHDFGWMTKEYLHQIHVAIENVKRVYELAGHDHTIIVTADHGGHDRIHGSQMDEDMIIPTFFIGPRFTPGKKLEGVSIMDIAPTVADVMGVPVPEEWEGKSLANQE